MHSHGSLSHELELWDRELRLAGLKGICVVCALGPYRDVSLYVKHRCHALIATMFDTISCFGCAIRTSHADHPSRRALEVKVVKVK